LCRLFQLLNLGDIVPFVQKAMQPPALAAVESAIANLQDLVIRGKILALKKSDFKLYNTTRLVVYIVMVKEKNLFLHVNDCSQPF